MIGPFLGLVLMATAIYQIIVLILEKVKHMERLIFSLIIFSLIALILYKPFGLIDFEKYESENILTATYTGTANCKTILQLKPENKFKYTSICFGKDFHFGRYELLGDTIHFHFKGEIPFIGDDSYARIVKENENQDTYDHVLLFQSHNSKRFISMKITEINVKELMQ